MTARKWLAQSTTGTGLSALFAYLAAVASGSMTWMQALPLLVGGLVGLAWPEDVGLKSAAQETTVSIERLVEAYRIGLQHGTVASSTLASPASSQEGLKPTPELGAAP